MIEIKELRKSYTTGGFVNHALDGVSIVFRDNEFVAVLGPSGSGKTTLLNVLGGLDRADSGDIVINGVSTKNYKASDWDTYRNHRIGFIFQSYNLIPHQSVLANVELALTLANVPRAERTRRAKAMLEKVGLAEHINKKPSQLSGGQMQRVAIARALVNDPDIVLADEPTGALDTETGIQVMDLLSEVAKDRLVIMVTHNPDLANAYASRIVSFHDGRVVGDTDPITAAESSVGATPRARHAAAVPGSTPDASDASAFADEAPAEAGVVAGRHARTVTSQAPEPPETSGFAARENRVKSKKASMGFLTALSLSFNNLMTKKGRTFLTAFAGSIGIIGIAAILALSNGVNAYIADTEEEALTAYPLTITKSSFDLTNLMTGMAGYTSDEEKGGDATTANLIPQSTIMTDMFAKVKNNDLVAFKAFLDGGGDGIWDYVNDIEYSFGLKPLVYKSDTSSDLVKLNPSYMSSVFSNGLNTSSLMSMGSGMDTFQEMLEDRDLVESQMEVVEGRWPENYDEAVLVLSRHGKISDYTLYSLGVLDPKKMEDMTKQALNGEDVVVPNDHVDFSYQDAMGMTFKVVPAAYTFQRSESGDTWTDMSKDTDFMRQRVEEGIEMKIVGIVKAREDSNAVMLSEGVAYPKELTYHLMELAGDTDIVKEQLANRDRDVFTGKTFDELQDDQGGDFDLDDIFTVDEDALSRAFSFDTSAFSNLGASGAKMPDMSSGNDSTAPSEEEMTAALTAGNSQAVASVINEETMGKVMAGIPAFDPQKAGLTDEETNLTPEQEQAVADAANALGAGFAAWAGPRLADPDADRDALLREYLATDEAQAIMAPLNEALQPKTDVIMQKYLQNQVAPYMAEQMQGLMMQAGQAMAASMVSAMTAQMAAMNQSISESLTNAVSGMMGQQMSQISKAMEGAFSFDADAFANAIQFNMTEDDLTSLLTNYMNADELTYDANLAKLGYASKDNPESISIYSKDFPAKEAVLDIIDGYNDKAAADGDDSDTIQYSDIAGVLMSSVTDIVDTISLVLIAFVSISLVVSSIMIAIVTYISVLERKKEIGVLRAMGASKGNIANVFNAETIIEGLIAGVFAIAVVLAVSVPVNQIIWETQEVPNVMQLPWDAAAILIGISVLLTFVAGLIPSQKAAHADPVEALRSE